MELFYTHILPDRGAQGRTLAFEKITKEEFEDLFNKALVCLNPVSVPVRIGIANLHPKEQYNRKVGREVATSKMSTQLMELSSIRILTQTIEINLINTDLDIGLTYKKYKDTGKIRAVVSGWFW